MYTMEIREDTIRIPAEYIREGHSLSQHVDQLAHSAFEGRFDDDGNTRPLHDFLALDLSIARKLSENARFRLAVHNLADEEIQPRIQTRLSTDDLVYLGAPRHWTAFLEWKF